jgi:hypothetical protein
MAKYRRLHHQVKSRILPLSSRKKHFAGRKMMYFGAFFHALSVAHFKTCPSHGLFDHIP